MSSRRTTPWPRRLAKDTALTARTLDVAGTEQWFRLRADGDAYRWQCARPTGRQWEVADIGDPCHSIGDAIDLNRGNMSYRKGAILEVDTQPEHEWTVLHGLVPRHFDPEDGDGWPADVVNEWSQLDDALPLDIPHAQVWATINGARVVLFTRDDNDAVHPALYDLDENSFRGLRAIAESSWFSEGGGAPISWNGGSRLTELYPGMLLSEAWGDARQETKLVPASGPGQRARAVADFIFADGQQLAAACLLEEFDPTGQLSQQSVQEWEELLADLQVSVSLTLEPHEELPACREDLHQDPAYAAVVDAFANPTSNPGLALRRKVETVQDSGVIGGVLGHGLQDLGATDF